MASATVTLKLTPTDLALILDALTVYKEVANIGHWKELNPSASPADLVRRTESVKLIHGTPRLIFDAAQTLIEALQ